MFLKNKLFSFYNYIIYLFISYIFSSFLLINIIAILKPNYIFKNFFYLLHFFIIFIINFFLLNGLKKIIFIRKLNFSFFNFPLLISGLLIFFFRSVIYFHAIDDFVHHMITGFYAYDIWTTKNFFATDTVYWFPLLQISYFPLLEFLGIRFTLLFLSLIQLFWFLSLNYRFSEKLGKERSFYINLFFIFLFFLPELMLSHVTFMSDFYTILFALEVLYILNFSKEKKYSYFLFFLTILTKQSTGFFTIPFLAYFLIKNLKNLSRKEKKIIFLFYLFGSFYFIRSWIELSNPLGILYTNIFKTPLADPATPKQADARFGPTNFAEFFYWPFISYFTNRHVEFLTLNLFNRIVYPLFLIIPYCYSLINFIRRRKIIFLIMISSIYLWLWQTGNGRYQIAMTSLFWIYFLINELKNLPKVDNFLFNLIFLFVFNILFFSNLWNDYAWRGFILEKFFPPKINQYYLSLFKQTFKYFGKDRYQDLFFEIKDKFNGYKQIIIFKRGVQTYYAFLANKYLDIPIYSYISKEKIQRISKAKNISDNIKKSINEMVKEKPFLYLSNKDFGYQEKNTWIFKDFKCEEIKRDKTVDQFMHDNYFNYVIEYRCQ